MFIESARRRAGIAAVVASLAVVPLFGCGSDAPAATRAVAARSAVEQPVNEPGAVWGLVQAQSSDVVPTADTSAIWGVLQHLSAHDVEVLYASFSPDVRDDLAEIVHAVASSALG
jgi:hypothetical protein